MQNKEFGMTFPLELCDHHLESIQCFNISEYVLFLYCLVSTLIQFKMSFKSCDPYIMPSLYPMDNF